MPIPQLVTIEAGSLEMRDARTGATRGVTLEPFEIALTTVTDANLRPAHPVTWFDAVTWCNLASVDAGLTPAYVIRGRMVDWDVSADGFRLPTEAEWEYACRAGTTGPTYGPLADIAWTALDGVEGPQEVGLKRANDFGLYDTLGNVWEWCWDYADPARYRDYRSLRGGGWDDPAYSCRASVRRGSAPDAVLEDVGFRVARGASGEGGDSAAQGWSRAEDRARADIRGPIPVGWTPLRELFADNSGH